ncbi:helix-turn-helix domain-containing protein [Streptomyces spinosisporus]|uniref:Helix-turn-helix domain containing protein n=1 Tax=Streptomyces spinosisporus TaxID=2927582 RepID=A0ABS9XRZ6_9ACTN|nr:helix-turn-helix domain-containing protein [Streptomyces spinosisporus]MCI3244845.1 helix-turn-helix domain containing protein [Streptomyces spinosisporus]
MYDVSTRRRALALVSQGRSLNSVSRATGISRAAIRSWQSRLEPLPRMAPEEPGPPADPQAYAYLLGLYLGDGCVSAHPRSGYYLRIACADAWPGLIELCRDAIKKVRPAVGVYFVQKQGCTAVTSYSRHWPALFPQHGPGKKHDRRIALEPWQREIVDAHPWEFVRGLIHSDGCRITNWTTRLVGGERKRYEYPRYFFTNVSDDIRKLYTDTLDKLGVGWTRCTRNGVPYNISVAKKGCVALLDAHVGPKF